MQRVLLIGGGHAHAVALRHLARGAANLSLHLVSDAPVSYYSGLLPGHIAGHWPLDALAMPLAPLAAAADCAFTCARVVHLDAKARKAQLSDGLTLTFDIASIDIGITSPRHGFAHAAPAKPIAAFALSWEAYLQRARATQAPPRAGVIGAGLGGVELALSALFRLKAIHPQAEVYLIDQAERVAAQAAPSLSRALTAHLARAGVNVHLSARVAAVEANAIVLASGTRLLSDFTMLATGATPDPALNASGLELKDGFVSVDAHLRSTSHPHIFACGDIAHFSPAPSPKAGVFAVRQGGALAHNLQALARGTALKPYRPQTDYLKLVSLGDRRALAEKWGVALNAPLLWTLKRRIDFDFMSG